MKKVRIEMGSGHPACIRITDLETGELLTDVSGFELHAKVGEPFCRVLLQREQIVDAVFDSFDLVIP